MKQLAVASVLAILASTTAHAELEFRVTDLEKQLMEVKYIVRANKPRAREYVFPDGGFTFASDTIAVKEVYETASDKELAWEIIPAPRNPSRYSVKVFYPYSLTRAGTRTTIVVEGRSDDISQDAENRHVFKYETSHKTTFVVPEGHRLVYTNYPVTLYEHEDHVVAEVRSTSSKSLMFKTRAE